MTHDVMTETLAERFSETRRAIAMGANNSVVEIFASEETGTWTITVTQPGGLTCMVAAGEGYEATNEQLPPEGIDG